MIRELQLLRRLDEQHGVTYIALQGLPVAMQQDGSVVIVNAADYIHDTQELRSALAGFRRMRPNDPGGHLCLWREEVDAHYRKTS